MPGKEYYSDMKRSENIVAKYLNDMNFDWYFEHPVFLFDEKERPRVWTPDFYIPALQLHIEVCGSKDFDYDYRKRIYEKNDVPIVFLPLYEETWENTLRKRILEIEIERHNKVMKSCTETLSEITKKHYEEILWLKPRKNSR